LGKKHTSPPGTRAGRYQWRRQSPPHSRSRKSLGREMRTTCQTGVP
jgi:hypothetical protein